MSHFLNTKTESEMDYLAYKLSLGVYDKNLKTTYGAARKLLAI